MSADTNFGRHFCSEQISNCMCSVIFGQQKLKWLLNYHVETEYCVCVCGGGVWGTLANNRLMIFFQIPGGCNNPSYVVTLDTAKYNTL